MSSTEYKESIACIVEDTNSKVTLVSDKLKAVIGVLVKEIHSWLVGYTPHIEKCCGILRDRMGKDTVPLYEKFILRVRWINNGKEYI